VRSARRRTLQASGLRSPTAERNYQWNKVQTKFAVYSYVNR